MSDDNQQNPLDVLEEILKKNQGGAAAAAGQPVPEQPPQPAGPTQEELEEKALADAQRMLEEQRARDQVLIKQQLEQIQTEIPQTEQYQERVEQIAEQQEEDTKVHAQEDEYEIFQLERKRVEVEPD